MMMGGASTKVRAGARAPFADPGRPVIIIGFFIVVVGVL